ncbi:MAG: anaerobic ribonucleoside-triphosphate reductase activating protein [Candidatus Moranbacteria bacterium RIFCSPLOWO2_02_FULL_48_19]|nr:MAG: anaerobic ribonucleoside-triphosphate reductase activating protein [Candidatus Moranbacteria bacterium RIFCSPLOWO2_02_FULL_48_19]OGI31964.1 MAG: anaerobic ribonucleoside-triphosphate reductase activating protein [Candidatus Moranbacteria bacterium RIFCSPLOWO2_12_FULL_48_12]
MVLSGIQKFTLIDYPGKIACVLFTGGCNYRCGFCHNPEFVLPEELAKLSKSFIPEVAALNFLKKRRGMLEGVVISGGEPTIMPDLEDFIMKVRDLGFAVKLDSNGNRPEVLRSLIDKGLVDYIAMDFKTSLPDYRSLVGQWADEMKLRESIELLKQGDVDYEFRTTLIREVHTPEILKIMSKTLAGAKRLYLQTFRSGIVLDPVFKDYHAFSSEEMQDIAKLFSDSVEGVFVREE